MSAYEPKSARHGVEENDAHSPESTKSRKTRSDNGSDVGPHRHVGVNVDPEVTDTETAGQVLARLSDYKS